MATTGTPRRSAPTTPAAPRPPARTGNGSGNGKGSGKGRPAPRRKRSPFWAGVKTFFQLITFFVLVAVVTLMVWAFFVIRQTPTTIDIDSVPLGITYVYSSDGTELAEFFTERRKVVPIDDIPKDMQNATVAFEDKRFYQHQGVDFKGIARALYSNLRHGDMKGEGGSTITQQLARNIGVDGLDRRKSFGRKVKELIVANQIENSYTKQEILTMYLNLVNYGSGAYGVEAAAEVYFNKHIKQLDLAQCALLAGLPNRPNDFNPYNDMNAAKAQQGRVLSEMLEQGTDHAAAVPARHQREDQAGRGEAGPAGQPDLPRPLLRQLRRGPDPAQVRAGLHLRRQPQDLHVAELAHAADRRAGRAERHCRRARTRPDSGGAGRPGPEDGRDQGDGRRRGLQKEPVQHRHAGAASARLVVQGRGLLGGDQRRIREGRHDGSRRPRVLSQRPDSPTMPKDDNGYSDRRVTLREAMAQSINVPAVQGAAPDRAADRRSVYARMMGVQSPLDPVLSLALGSSGVTPLEMASVYSTFPAGGNHPEPTAWTRLTDMDDNVIEDVPPAIETHVLQKDTVNQLDDMLRAVVTEGTADKVEDMPPDARGKTGTTQGHKDVWFVGYTPDLVCAVWAGHPIYKSKNLPPAYGEEMEGNAWGATVCAPIFAHFMSQSLPIFKAYKAKEAARLKAHPVAARHPTGDHAGTRHAAPAGPRGRPPGPRRP